MPIARGHHPALRHVPTRVCNRHKHTCTCTHTIHTPKHAQALQTVGKPCPGSVPCRHLQPSPGLGRSTLPWDCRPARVDEGGFSSSPAPPVRQVLADSPVPKASWTPPAHPLLLPPGPDSSHLESSPTWPGPARVPPAAPQGHFKSAVGPQRPPALGRVPVALGHLPPLRRTLQHREEPRSSADIWTWGAGGVLFIFCPYFSIHMPHLYHQKTPRMKVYKQIYTR